MDYTKFAFLISLRGWCEGQTYYDGHFSLSYRLLGDEARDIYMIYVMVDTVTILDYSLGFQKFTDTDTHIIWGMTIVGVKGRVLRDH